MLLGVGKPWLRWSLRGMKMFKSQIPDLVKTLKFAAEDGMRIELDGKTAYAGLGNRAGLHSYIPIALAERFKKWPRVEKKILAGEWKSLKVLDFHNINRDRGRWVVVRTYSIEE